MTRDEYEQRKRRLDEQLRAGIELLEAAHRQQVRALELVWMTTAEEDLTLPQAHLLETAEVSRAQGPAEPARTSRRKAWQLSDEIEDILGSLPEVFDRNHVTQALGYEPDRGSLYRVLEQLARSGVLSIQMRGAGKVSTKYRKTGASASPDIM
jgi:hypothetical protein